MKKWRRQIERRWGVEGELPRLYLRFRLYQISVVNAAYPIGHS